jgi:hypothetical protein
MSARIRFMNGLVAEVRDYRWTCEDKDIERVLQYMTPDEGPWASDPEPDNNLARNLAVVMQAEVIGTEPHVPAREGEVQ